MTISNTYGAASATIGGAPTLAQQLAITKNRPSGFDYMRIVLALSVICWHSLLISYGTDTTAGVWGRVLQPLSLLIVPMFFALSGFLVAGSLERSRSLVGFLGLRVFRIMPALVVEVLLSALILGPLLTTASLGSYFADPVLHSYFWNILGDIHYKLPGLFQQNPTDLVNGQLWTVPYELVCYILLSVLTVVGIVRRRAFLLGFLVLYYAAQLANTLLRAQTDYQGAGGSSIVMAFITGVVFYRYRERIPWSRGLFLAMLIVSVVLPMFLPKGMRFAAIPITYVTVYLGLMNPRRNRLVLSGDYSYGLYLYGFPVQQAVYSASPAFHTWYASILISVPIAAAVAALSWWFVEQPVLRRRDKLKAFEDWYLRRFHGRPSRA
jgi:peptidoglycan/LPS O-acetylase OafA/YrhL